MTAKKKRIMLRQIEGWILDRLREGYSVFEITYDPKDGMFTADASGNGVGE